MIFMKNFEKGSQRWGRRSIRQRAKDWYSNTIHLTETILVRLDEETTLELTKDQILCEEPLPPQKKSKKKA